MSSYDAKIIGAGSWGRALAHALLQNKKKVLIFSRSSENEYSSNNIQQTNNIDEVFADDGPVVIATPVSTLSDIGQLIKKNNFSGALLLACKGIDPHLGLFPSEIISKYVDSKKIAILSVCLAYPFRTTDYFFYFMIDTVVQFLQDTLMWV